VNGSIMASFDSSLSTTEPNMSTQQILLPVYLILFGVFV
jgi:hypothetical protein